MDLSLQGLSMVGGPPAILPAAGVVPLAGYAGVVSPPAQPPVVQEVFGAVVPGRPVRTDFAPIDATGLKFVLNLNCPGDLAHPLSTIPEIVFFLLPGIELPPDHGVLVYVQLVPATNLLDPGIAASLAGFQLLGAITRDHPSSVLSTGWGEKEELIDLSNRGVPITVTIAASIEPMPNLQNLGVAPLSPNNPFTSNNSNEKRLHVAQQIAYDLFYFMQSFDTGAGGPGNMVVPQNIFDRWFKRFENRFRRDPNFFMKKRDYS